MAERIPLLDGDDSSDDNITLSDDALNDNDINITLKVGTSNIPITIDKYSRIMDIKQKHFEKELLLNKNIRIIFRGKLLINSDVLDSQYVEDGSTLHVVISNHHGTQSQSNNPNPIYDHNLDDSDLYNDADIAAQLQEQLNNEQNIIEIDMTNFNDMLNNNNAINNTQFQHGNRNYFFCGFLLGLVLGSFAFLLMFTMRNNTSKAFRLGLVTGILVNVTFNTFNPTNNNNNNNNSNNNTNSNINSNENDNNINSQNNNLFSDLFNLNNDDTIFDD